MKKRFDAVAWMRQRRTQIDEEDGTLTWAQKRQRTHEQVLQDPVLAPLCGEVVAPEKVALRTRKKPLSSASHRRTRARRS
jgi:hypothetical protein